MWAWSHDHRPSTHTNNQSISWLHLIYIMHANHQTWFAYLHNVDLDMLQIIQAKEGSFSCLPLIDWLILSQKTPFTQLNPSPFFLKANFPRRVRAAWRIIFIPIARQFIYTSISHPFPPKPFRFKPHHWHTGHPSVGSRIPDKRVSERQIRSVLFLCRSR